MAAYATVILIGVALALPNLLTSQQLTSLPNWLPKQQVTLGLDLRGGSHLVLEIDSRGLVQERLQDLAAGARRDLKLAGIEPESIRRQSDSVIVTLKDAGRQSDAVRELEKLAMPIDPFSFGAGGGDLKIATEAAGQIRISLTQAALSDRVNAAIGQSLEIIRRRIDQVGVAEPTIQRAGVNRILVQLPGVQDPARIRELIGSTAKLTFHLLAQDDPAGPVSPGVRVLPGANSGERYAIEDHIALSGERLRDARPDFDPQTNQPIVSFRLNSIGASEFAAITQANVGEPFAIVLDGKVLSAPVIREPITGGSGQISGHFTVTQASDLAALLRAGALPAPFTVIEERTVGADLGADAIEKGLLSGLIGFGLVFAFMFALYGAWGLVANFALALNVILTFGALSLLGATLTLPGIAGIVLGIGLAVDANVLINERIREESRKGLSALAALDAGFRRAYATIVDSNVTALIATTLLFMFGSGPIRGFAVTMGLGILISMFTAVSIVRVIMTSIVGRWRMKTLRIEPLFGLKLIPDATAIPFMRAQIRRHSDVHSPFAGVDCAFFQTGIELRRGLSRRHPDGGGDEGPRRSLKPSFRSRFAWAWRSHVTGVRQSIDGARPGRTPARRRGRPKRGRSKHPGEAFGDCGRFPDRANGGCRPKSQRRTCLDGHMVSRTRELRDAHLHLGPLRMGVRDRSHRHSCPRCDKDRRFFRGHRDRLQPHRHCRASHTDWLFGE